ncbi:MAG: hypothetical protein FWC95_01690 [Defluviitaleaceae bacterium]|nr:hypothetical protein [Defluviitaleaceae bacterium]
MAKIKTIFVAAAVIILIALAGCANNIVGTWEFVEEREYIFVDGRWMLDFAYPADKYAHKLTFGRGGTGYLSDYGGFTADFNWELNGDNLRIIFGIGGEWLETIEISRNELRFVTEGVWDGISWREVGVYKRVR